MLQRGAVAWVFPSAVATVGVTTATLLPPDTLIVAATRVPGFAFMNLGGLSRRGTRSGNEVEVETAAANGMAFVSDGFYLIAFSSVTGVPTVDVGGWGAGWTSPQS